MKVKIVSDGTPCGTTILDADTGVDISAGLRCTRIVIGSDADGTIATLTLERVPVEFIGDANFENVATLSYDPEDNDSLDQAIAHLQAQRKARD